MMRFKGLHTKHTIPNYVCEVCEPRMMSNVKVGRILKPIEFIMRTNSRSTRLFISRCVTKVFKVVGIVI